MPVFTPYTGMPSRSTARAWRQRRSTARASSGASGEPAPGGDLADQSRAEVGRRAQGTGRGRRAQLLVALLRKMWPMAVG